MKALRVEKKRLAVRDVEKPLLGDEALVRVLLSGICNTDLEISRGYAGFKGTIGHEFVGVVEEASNPTLAGKRVVGEINVGCGQCELCRGGDPRHCASRTVLGIVGRDGAHAEFLRLPAENLVPVPERIPDEHAVFAEPLAAACAVLECVSIKNSEIGKHSAKLRIAERRGIETTTVKQAAKRKREFDVTVEASGVAEGFKLALDLLAPKGKLVLKSTFNGTTEVDAARTVVDEISIVGSRCGRFLPAIDYRC